MDVQISDASLKQHVIDLTLMNAQYQTPNQPRAALELVRIRQMDPNGPPDE